MSTRGLVHGLAHVWALPGSDVSGWRLRELLRLRGHERVQNGCAQDQVCTVQRCAQDQVCTLQGCAQDQVCTVQGCAWSTVCTACTIQGVHGAGHTGVHPHQAGCFGVHPCWARCMWVPTPWLRTGCDLEGTGGLSSPPGPGAPLTFAVSCHRQHLLPPRLCRLLSHLVARFCRALLAPLPSLLPWCSLPAPCPGRGALCPQRSPRPGMAVPAARRVWRGEPWLRDCQH